MLKRNGTQPPGPGVGAPRVGLPELGAVLFRIGATTFGGMWAATQKLEAELVRRRSWLTAEEQRSLMITSTLIPAPKFLAFGGLVGYRLGGLAGSVVALFALLAPGALVVLLGVMLLSPEVMGPAIVPLQRAVGIAIVGLLLGNAFRQVSGSKVRGRRRALGVTLGACVAVAAMMGVSLIVAAGLSLALGAVLLPGEDERS